MPRLSKDEIMTIGVLKQKGESHCAIAGVSEGAVRYHLRRQERGGGGKRSTVPTRRMPARWVSTSIRARYATPWHGYSRRVDSQVVISASCCRVQPNQTCRTVSHASPSTRGAAPFRKRRAEVSMPGSIMTVQPTQRREREKSKSSKIGSSGKPPT